MAKEKYYTLDNILTYNADYNVIYGERSNGKTTSVLLYAFEQICSNNYQGQLAIIRRYADDYKGAKGQQMFESFMHNGWVEKYTHGEYNSIKYYSAQWFLCKYDEDGELVAKRDKPFALAFSLSSEEHYKSTSYPDVKWILFDEFISRQYYLPQEFVTFQNLLSTIIRLRDDVKIFMCGNTINKYCVYFAEMGLSNIKKQDKGSIDLYTYGESELRVAVEYSDFPMKKKKSNKYFAFNNPKLNMITDGGWEIDIYPHLPYKYKPKDVVGIFYIKFEGDILQGNVIQIKDDLFIYIHYKTKEIKEDTTRRVYQQSTDVRYNYSSNIFKIHNKFDKYVNTLINMDKVFYQDNEVGEIVRNYFNWCRVNK